ncbi:MAG TPA: glycosyltransferase family 1 protein [Vicinamibacterales bacterium]
MRVGIDGSNLRQGGGVTHLVQLLAAAEPQEAGIETVIVWGAPALLDCLPARPWLDCRRDPHLQGGAGTRAYWQQIRLTTLARESADLLFVPGGTYLGRFHPFVTMFRNMLPFDSAERAHYGLSGMRMKLEVLRHVQTLTFRRADGVIFLTEHARRRIMETTRVRGLEAVIPHGLDSRFFRAIPSRLVEYSPDRPFRWLYVSAFYRYKHPWNVVEALAMLRKEGAPMVLDLVGPLHPRVKDRLEDTIRRLDPEGKFVNVIPPVAHEELPAVYHGADAFVFASTCENLPNSLLEAMAAGLPIVSSQHPPMPDILGDAGVYCDPEIPASIAGAMKRLWQNPELRARIATAAQERAKAYDWRTCARTTFMLLAQTRHHTAGQAGS